MHTSHCLRSAWVCLACVFIFLYSNVPSLFFGCLLFKIAGYSWSGVFQFHLRIWKKKMLNVVFVTLIYNALCYVNIYFVGEMMEQQQNYFREITEEQ